MAKRKTSRSKDSSVGPKMSPVIQFGVAFIIVAAIALAYYAGMMR